MLLHAPRNVAVKTGSSNFCTLDIVFKPTLSGIRTFPLTIVSNDTPATQVLTLTSTGLSPTIATSGGEIFTVAGLFPGDQLNRGDNISALLASLNAISGIVTDSAGNIIFSEYGYCQIRKVSVATGIISTIAGINPDTCNSDNAGAGVDGDGAPATQALLYGPSSLVYGSNGTLYFADVLHHKIRSIDTLGIIHTIAGTDALVCAYTVDGLAAVTASICSATGLAIDSNRNIFYSDPANQIIARISAAGILSRYAGVVSTAGGSYSGDGGPSLSAHLNNSAGIAIDKSGNIYFSDRSSNIVRK